MDSATFLAISLGCFKPFIYPNASLIVESKTDTPFRIDNLTITPKEYTLEDSDGNKKLLQPKFIEVLAYLAGQYPRLVSREELIEAVWEGNFYVGEKSLTNAIWKLRNELSVIDGDIIETVRKTGYRLLVEPIYLQSEQAVVKTEIIQAPTVKSFKLQWLALGSFLLIGLLAILYWVPLFHVEPKPVDSMITNITNDPGREVYPAVSPNARYVVYSWRHLRYQPNLYLKDLSRKDADPRQLTFSNSYEGRSVWHPNGEVIYFSRKSWDYSICEIMSLDVITNKLEKLANCTGELDFSISVSPDGEQLAFSNINRQSNEQRINLINLSDKTYPITQLQCQQYCSYKDLDVEFSPNGQYLAVARTPDDARNEDIFLLDLKTLKERKLTKTGGDIKGMTWHADSKRLVFSTKLAGKRDGYIVNINDGKTTKLNEEGLSYPKFIPQTNELIYHHWEVLPHLTSMAINSEIASTPFPLLQGSFSYESPHYSPTQEKLTFISNESGYDEIWTARADGTQRVKMTDMKSRLASPRWSHNGKMIAFLGPRQENRTNHLYVLNVATGAVKEIVTEMRQYYRPTWTIDDSALLVAAKLDRKSSLYSFKLNGQAQEILVNSKARLGMQDNDGRIWFTKGRHSGLWVIDPKASNAKPERMLTPEQFKVKYNWAMSAKGIYYQIDHELYHQVNFYDFATGEVAPFLRLPTGTLARDSSMTFIPSKQQIVFTQLDFAKVDIKRASFSELN